MAAFPEEDWVNKWVDVINSDPEIQRLGRWFDGRVLFEFDKAAYILKFVEGTVYSVISQPIWDKPWDFKISASEECWEKSHQDPPPPFYQDIFSMMWNHGMKLEGDVVKAMQHIRALKMVLAAMKHVR